MIDLDAINEEISKLEAMPPTYATIERLSWLYIVRDHNKGESSAPGTIAYNSGTDFCKAVHGKDEQCVLALMDELMSTIKQIYPRLYDAVLEKL